ncbi:MAG: hypothetical protein KAR19_15825 [Bacteroidales bacterium]|nr:hypothetical protein [Bacteroidales bacterium]
MLEVKHTNSRISFSDQLDHILVRMGIKRMGHSVEPGLYKLGNPGPASSVFVTANYTLSFDALRSNLTGVDSYILVLDTRGINVWCAAGKGTFGTDELIHRIELTGLKEIVNHRTLILPQLGAPGIAAHLVKEKSGFGIKYGPVRASDLSRYLELGKTIPEMRLVEFPVMDRLLLIPVELKHVLLPLFIAGTALYFAAGIIPALAVVSAFLSLNFTGATTFTSRTGVKKEIFRYFPAMVWLFGSGSVLFIATLVFYHIKL